jgi:hypothetical protein
MYHYEHETKKCEIFNYGGCGGTENRFISMKECVDTCKATNAFTPPGEIDENSPKLPFTFLSQPSVSCRRNPVFAMRSSHGSTSILKTEPARNSSSAVAVATRTTSRRRKTARRLARSTKAARCQMAAILTDTNEVSTANRLEICGLFSFQEVVVTIKSVNEWIYGVFSPVFVEFMERTRAKPIKTQTNHRFFIFTFDFYHFYDEKSGENRLGWSFI